MLNQHTKSKWIKFFKMSFKMKLLIIFAFFISGIMRLLILLMPSKKLINFMGHEGLESLPEINESDSNKALKVGWAVNAVCNNTPWESKCYVRALTAQLILKILRIPSTLYLGVARDKIKNLAAHAWLRSGQYYLTGEHEMGQFKCITFYSTQHKPS